MLSVPAEEPLKRAAVRPKAVEAPVAVTSASASPRTQVAPISAVPPAERVAGRDSPVMAELSIETVVCFFFSLSRPPPPSSPRITQSAGTADPAAILTMSPGTNSPASSVAQAPPRLAVALGFREAFNAATASWLLDVSWNPIKALTNWMKSKMPTSM